MLQLLGREGAVECRSVPANDSISKGSGGSLHEGECHMVPKRRMSARRALLDGNFARRKLPLREREYCIWDTELSGFGLRVRPSGNYFWFVRLRHRGKHRRITLGRTDELEAGLARAQARRILAEAALDGLPKRAVVKATPTMTDFVETYWDDLSRVWKPSTTKRNWAAWRLTIKPTFGDTRVADKHMLNKAEEWGYRLENTNPCRSVRPNRKRQCERFLTNDELARLGAELTKLRLSEDRTKQCAGAAITLLLLTGCRKSEILTLEWTDIKGNRLHLRDSKTGPRTVWLGSAAREVIAALPRYERIPYPFWNYSYHKPLRCVNGFWRRLRDEAGLPGVRIHDLRHTFASHAAMNKETLPMIGRLLGHANVQTTTRYAHLDDGHLFEAVQQIGDTVNALLAPQNRC